MFQHQAGLPRLPVPTLEQTCVKYLRTVRPLTTDAEYEATCKAVLEFLTSGRGAELQARLQARAGQKNADSSWFIDWWNGLSYFGYRDSVVLNVSYFYQFKDETDPALMDPVLRAARFVKGSLAYRRLIVTEGLAPEMAGGAAQDMSMYKFLFNAARVPVKPVDSYVTYDSTHYHHVVVCCKSHFFLVQTTDLATGTELSTEEIAARIAAVRARAQDMGTASSAVGVLSADDRDAWADSRSALLAADPSGRNAASLKALESAVLVVCLDDEEPGADTDARARQCWHGSGRNRFFDKPLQFVVSPSGTGGFLGEHGMMDGTPTLQLCNWLLDALAKGKIDHGRVQLGDVHDGGGAGATPPAAVAAAAAAIDVAHLPFKVDNVVSAAIAAAERNLDAAVAAHDLHVVRFGDFGKNGIKAVKVSPDAFCQMAIQLAYLRTTGKAAATYESCSTRRFLHGRTETIRSCSIESTAFVKAVDDSSLSNAEKYALLGKAAAAQSTYARACSQGQGIDRHLLGLKLSVKDGESMPEIFSDPSFGKSSHWCLSTSTLASEYFVSVMERRRGGGAMGAMRLFCSGGWPALS